MSIRRWLKSTLRAWGYDVTTYPQGSARVEAHLSLLLPRLDVDCVLDVGANEGQYGRMLRSIGYQGQIVSFEPVQSCYQKLAARASRDPAWRTFPCALGDADACLPIHVTASTDFSSFLRPNEYGALTFGTGPSVEHVEEVPVRRLDGLFAEHPELDEHRRVFLKMDTQGYDQAVLRGASGCLQRIAGLQSELSVRPVYAGAIRYLDALQRFEEAGFELTGVFPINRDRDLMLVELDCVMVRRPAASPAEAAQGGQRTARSASVHDAILSTTPPAPANAR